jgi:hypothetical protein
VAHHTYDDGVKKYDVILGWKDVCANFSLFSNAPDATLHAFSFKPECGHNFETLEKLVSGVGTRMMLKAGCKFIFDQWKHIKYISLIDKSYITCATKSARVSLPYYSLATCGKTWYQRYFDAVPENIIVNHHLEQTIHILESHEMMHFKQFFDKYIARFRLHLKIKGLYETLEDYYSNSSTYMDFFRKMKDDHDCVVFNQWLDYFMSDICQVNFSTTYWIIKNNPNWPNIKINRTEKSTFEPQEGGTLEGLHINMFKRSKT